jgi:hypothetical protein
MIPAPAAAHDLPEGATVRFQSHEFGPGWHVGTVQITSEGCAMVWKPAPDVSGGKRGLGIMFIQKLERQDGTKWIDMPVAPMMKREPQTCREGAG